jgi:uncharacterized membrane protein YhhN
VRNILLSLIVIFSLYYIFLIEIIPDSFILTFKLIPMILIIFLAILTKSSNAIAYKTLIIIALVFCAFGDYTLQWFIIGLSCFLVGHVFYFRAFLTTNEKTAPPLIWLFLIIYGGIMMLWIGMTLVNANQFILTIAVCIYIIVILTMGWASFKTGSIYASIGAILFIISDSILAINKFVAPIDYSHQLIMLTYYTAQIFITLSIANYSASQSKSATIKVA